MTIRYELEGTDGDARAGTIQTQRGPVSTPVFMPVGTRASVKGVLPRDLREMGATIVLGNTYHLMLRPGYEIIRAAGGLHEFMRWDGPMLTDSGGFQVFSLADAARIDDQGVDFRSSYDGASVRLDPAESMRVQRELGADIVMAFDQCVSLPASREEIASAVERTTRWAAACKEQPLQSHQSLFGIVQGGDDREQRAESAAQILEIGFPGYAIGGLSVGETADVFETICRDTAALLPADRPRYLMGVGTPRDLVTAVDAGVDMFDCVLPTRNGRNAQALTWGGVIRLRNASMTEDHRPIEEGCACPACGEGFTRSYLRHLFGVGEMLGPMLASLHNLAFYTDLMRRSREAILSGNYSQLRDRVLAAYPARSESSA